MTLPVRLGQEVHDIGTVRMALTASFTNPCLPLALGRAAALTSCLLILHADGFHATAAAVMAEVVPPPLLASPSRPTRASWTPCERAARRNLSPTTSFSCGAPVSAYWLPMCGGIVEDLRAHSLCNWWQHLGFIVSTMGAPCRKHSLRGGDVGREAGSFL